MTWGFIAVVVWALLVTVAVVVAVVKITQWVLRQHERRKR
jgi:hypothetical protein